MGLRTYTGLLILNAVIGLSNLGSVQAGVIHESASLGDTGQLSGYSLGSQYLGSRFSIDRPVIVQAVGGHIYGEHRSSGGALFLAIVSLNSVDALPSGMPFNETTMAMTLFSPPNPSEDILIPMSVRLDLGYYALVFGGEQFGASGEGALPFNNIDRPGQASYFRWDAQEQFWRDSAQGGQRFVVIGTVVPAPGAFLLASLGAGAVGFMRRRRSL